ncbi:hypothetical protein [Oceanibaculum indicum]|uniref:Uncharacterized protein n=1 Tax=Oceanibaculum indicum P24 TaxID=1207063 RepID=K2J7I2_9PROT|nr:hypothetical protein [Oceanibaculum indicum]EKE70882.1 hypothetical protein P24_15104 [Oceanibaculum indicum P24]
MNSRLQITAGRKLAPLGAKDAASSSIRSAEAAGSPSGATGPARKLRQITARALLEWTYRDQCADRLADAGLIGPERDAAGLEPRGSSADGVAALMRRDVLGVRIDGGPVGVSPRLHPDAEAVHDFVIAALPGLSPWMIRHARAGSCPDWGQAMRPRMEPDWKGEPRHDGFGRPVRGSYRMIYDANRNPIACAVQPADHVIYRDALRQDYRRWYDGVAAVFAAFRHGGLEAHRLSGIGADPMPWE